MTMEYETHYANGKLKERVFNTGNTIHKMYFGWYQDGYPLYEYTTMDGKLNGTTRIWYPSGFIRAKIPYKNNNYHGTQEGFRPNGFKSYVILWVDGVRHGDSMIYHENGCKKNLSVYVNGKLDGPSLNWYNNSNIMCECNWCEDELNGKVVGWDMNGNVKYVHDWFMGNLTTDNGEKITPIQQMMNDISVHNADNIDINIEEDIRLLDKYKYNNENQPASPTNDINEQMENMEIDEHTSTDSERNIATDMDDCDSDCEIEDWVFISGECIN